MQLNPIRTRTNDAGAGVGGGLSGTEVVMLQLLDALPAAESAAFAVKETRPSAVGIPLTTPVAGVTLNPAGSDPVIENV
jgi:hypothetical protein